METKRIGLEEEYLNKIVEIWKKKKLTISERIKGSLKVVDSIDKIKWPKGISPNLLGLAKTSLKLALLQAVEESIEKEFQVLPSRNVKEVFPKATK